MSNTLINITENGTTTLATSGKYCDRNIDVVVEVAGSGGGGGFEFPTELTVNGENWNVNGDWDWCIEAMPNTTITIPGTSGYSCKNMFARCHLTDLSHLHIVDTTPDRSKTSMFQGCLYLTELPVIDWKYQVNMFGISDIDNMFNSCYMLRTMPADFFKMTDENGNKTDQCFFNSSMTTKNAFANCYSLRKLPDFQAYWYSSDQSNLFLNCYCLDEIINIPATTYKLNSNRFSDTFSNCHRIKNLTFMVQADGTPYVRSWKSQVIDLSTYIGYTTEGSKMVDYNSGLTYEDNAYDEEHYQALKNIEDWWSSNVEYSRYNHDSAVATINSLPDTSAYGTNTIKFQGQAGALTDGGAINTLTEEEIAVASAKGWTVSLV
jgi:hypothetical protein